MTEERGWLIEGDGPVWRSGNGYTEDSLKAIRYARQEDAERQIDCWRKLAESAEREIAPDYLVATEHIWS